MRAQRGEVDLEVNALVAQDAELQAALVVLEANVATQQAELEEAERALDEAEAEVAAATEAVGAAQARIDMLGAATDDLVVEAYVDPPTNNGLDAFRNADSLSDVAVKPGAGRDPGRLGRRPARPARAGPRGPRGREGQQGGRGRRGRDQAGRGRGAS